MHRYLKVKITIKIFKIFYFELEVLIIEIK